ncbi:MAG: response regulator [Candidatus Hydrogenedentota bacterium]|jgi:CheY-like chemotaxis protein|uniref:Two-component hybrid sensor and regulator n=1 Tax=Sumerlaea chitinivorans TaxID=2250252 RepID=A0A2Z4Y295_SUMC1|nr:Two-component hybrid sensor and regulator [Candidatus Sumerlaea chitinivorans]RMH28049.1 MAG: response regulator [Candidatus Hydrogenedentota bacterium]GIX45249.1 MAG: response regulator [Candidatus Sumerlaea sp.]
MRILLIDDNPDAAMVVASFLKALDHQVFPYNDAREALLWLKDIRPELVIADLDMPGMSGFEFLRRFRAYTSFASTPVVCVTGTEATDEEIYAAGFAAILRKPVTLSDVMDCIDQVTEQKQKDSSIVAPEEATGGEQGISSVNGSNP